MRRARRAPGSRAPAAAAASRSSASPVAAAPRFVQLIRVALESVGVRYVSVDLLRKAKRNSISQRECWELWKLLHDVVTLVVADFDVDFDEMARLNSGQELEDALRDPEQHRVRVEIVRWYLHDWGFLSRAFYATHFDPSGQELLLAFAWLVAHSKLIERQHHAIVKQYLGMTSILLPPFPNDVVLDDQLVADAVTEATRGLSDRLAAANQAEAGAFEDQIHQLHVEYGRLQHSVGELLAFHRCHQRLLTRLEGLQSKSMTASPTNGGGERSDTDELLPASILQLLAQPKAQLDTQLRTVACSLQVLDDEMLFYKWVNGVVADLSTSSSDAAAVSEGTLDPKLEECKQTVDTLLQAEAYRQLTQSFKSEWQKWKQQVKNSRSRVEQMEAKFDAVMQQIRRAELLDPQKLFLLKPRHGPPRTRHLRSKGSARTPEALDEELARLETQLGRVLGEITSEYCHLALQ